MITVYKYGTPSWIDIPATVKEQMWLAHNLREDLVTLEHRREQAVKDIWSSYPAVAQTESDLASAEEQARALAEQVSRAKSQQRTRAPKTAATAELRGARAVVKQLRQARREAISAVREDAKARLDQVFSDYNAAVKALYADYAQTRGLYWATFNDVVDHHRSAVKRVSQARAAGKPASLRHHRFDGSGTIAVQLQRQNGEPQRTPALLASGAGKWRNVLQVRPWMDPGEFDVLSRAEQRQVSRGTATLSIGNGRAAELPVIVHRMLPADADVVGARLVIRRVAAGSRVHLSVSARVPDATAVPLDDGPTVAVHFGWRRISDDGTLRVATWRATDVLTVPSSLSDVVRRDSTTSGTIVLPGTWRASVSGLAELASQRSLAFDAIREKLVSWLRANPPEPETEPPADGLLPRMWPTAADVAKWRSPGRVVAWARRVQEQDDHDNALVELLAQIETWRKGDRHLWEQEEHGRDKVLGRRDDAWRRIAAWLSDTCGQIVLDDTVLTELTGTETSTPTNVAVLPTKQRIDAAVGTLRQSITAAAQRNGVTVTRVAHTGVTRVHADCGHLNPADDRYRASIDVLCDGCGVRFDQDRSATINMLASTPEAPESPGTARAAS